MRRVQIIAGERFGRLVAVAPEESRKGNFWNCLCDCGKSKVLPATSLRSGNTTSCGCLVAELTLRRNRRHGEATRGNKSPEYTCYRNMMARCYHPKAAQYRHYGGRGITVCDRWRFGEDGKSGFECFLEDMGRRPSPKHSIDRERNEDGYSKANCRWALHVTQVRNSRHNRLIGTPIGLLSMSSAAEEYGLPYDRLRSRLRMGWDHEAALVVPAPSFALVVKGTPMTVRQAASLGSLSEGGVAKRLAKGWSPEEAIFAPRQKTGPKAKSTGSSQEPASPTTPTRNSAS